MITTRFRFLSSAAFFLFLAWMQSPTLAADGPKKLLVVTTTVGFPHSSIPTAEKVLAQLGEKSGVFTVDIVGSGPRPRDKAQATAWMEKMTKDLAEKMNPDALTKYDGFIFANTTGVLPLPDKKAFLESIRGGKAFIGMHSASDSFHGEEGAVDPYKPGVIDPYTRMLGGEFRVHYAQVPIDCLVVDPKHPASAALGDVFKIAQEEVYLMKNYDASRVHELLVLDKHPNDKGFFGRFPVSWCSNYGEGRVFYTSLGHREDIWDPEWKDSKGVRLNSPEVARSYQAHILGGIKWALGLEPGDAKPQMK
jgi:type 1 glutamine amidotransferase